MSYIALVNIALIALRLNEEFRWGGVGGVVVVVVVVVCKVIFMSNPTFVELC